MSRPDTLSVLNLKEFKGIKILRASEFLKIILKDQRN